MKLIRFILCCCLFPVFAQDPFRNPVKTKLFLQQKYQYLGYIKGPQVYFGFLRRSGAGILRLSFGKNPSFGEVVSITKDKICIKKTSRQWCLYKASQPRAWVLQA